MATVPSPLPTPPSARSTVGPDRPMLLGQTSKAGTKTKPVDDTATRKKEDISIIQFFQDAREALVGIPADMLAKQGTMYDIVTTKNRLRGIGVVLIVIALVLAITDIIAPQCN